MLVLVIGLILFLGPHSVRIFASGWAEARSAAMGENAWKGIYSLVSVLGFVLIVYGYGLARLDAPVFYVPPAWMTHVTALLMVFAFIALGAYMLPAGRLKLMLKHPMLLAVKIWAFAHLLANGDLASILLFGAFLAWAVLDRISVKRRGVAISSGGPVKWDVAAVATGLVLYGLFVWKLHWWLIGAHPFVLS
ncbi:MAG: NnrU family protein [Notoacmeibacter sp.]|nr:NnrU family protein [Notoacmeibacter sp.]